MKKAIFLFLSAVLLVSCLALLTSCGGFQWENNGSLGGNSQSEQSTGGSSGGQTMPGGDSSGGQTMPGGDSSGGQTTPGEEYPDDYYTEGLTFELRTDDDGDEYYAVTGYNGDSQEVVIPNIYLGKPVKEIGYRAFSQNNNITHITIGANVTSIGEYAFSGCIGLTGELKIPDSVTSIGNSAFYGCSGPTSVVIGDGVTSIEDWAFSDCKGLTSIKYMGTLEGWCKIDFASSTSNPLYYAHELYIGEELLAEADIPKTITEIKDYAFYGYTSITKVTIPSTVTSIGSYAFYGCINLTGGLEIPDSITSIESYAFYGCSGLTGELKIPDSVTSIGGAAFMDCSGLTGELKIPDGVTSIGGGAFELCSGLTSVKYMGTLEDWCKIEFADYWSNPLSCAHELYIGDELLTEADIPETINKIKDCAFCGCTSITKVTIPNTVTSIGNNAFYNCDGLTGDLKIPDSVTSIGIGAFSGGRWLTSVVIGSGVASIEDWAFGSCYGLQTVYYKGANEAEWNSISIGIENDELKNTTRFYYSDTPNYDGEHWHYDNDKPTVWMYREVEDDFYTSGLTFELKNSESDGSYYVVTGYNGTDKGIVIPATYSNLPVKEIGENAFRDNENITYVIIGKNIENIGYMAFYNSSLTGELKIPDGVTSIGGGAFELCSGLTSVKYMGTLEDWCKIEFADYWSNPLSCAHELYIGDELLTEADIPETINKIKDCAFCGCTSITKVTIPNTVTSIGNNAFYNCDGLTGDLKIPDSVTSIGIGAFSGGRWLTSVVIGSGVASIEDWAFRSCYGLQTVYYKGANEAEWNSISIGDDNDYLKNAKRYYYSDDPIYDGQHWHYNPDTNEPEVWAE